MEKQQPSPVWQNTQPPTSGVGLWVSYNVGVLTRLRTFVQSAGRFFGVMKPSTDTNELGPFLEFGNLDKGMGFKDIDSFCISLQNIYMRYTTQKIDRERWKVTRISMYKDTNTGAKHEYLLATMRYGKLKIYMRIERNVQKSKVGNLVGSSAPALAAVPVTSDDSDPSPKSDSPPDAPISRKKGIWSKIASDEVSFSTSLTELGTGSDTIVDVIDFNKDSHIPLPRLAVLVRCVNNLTSEYHLLTQNCYWFAHVTAEVLKELYPDHTVSTPQGAKRQGMWNSLPMHLFFKDSEDVVEKVVEAFPVQWNQFVMEVTQIAIFCVHLHIPCIRDPYIIYDPDVQTHRLSPAL